MIKRIFAAGVVALFVSGAAVAANLEAGKEKARPCAACHGADGNSASPDFPRLAGQYYDYLVRALTDYKSGARKNPIMAPQAASLSRRDMEDIAAYFSEQRGLVEKR